MTINDFPVSIAVDVRSRAQLMACRVHMTPTAPATAIDALHRIVSDFAAAGNLGMLSGGTRPELARLAAGPVTRRGVTSEVEFALSEIAGASGRVLIGMLRGEVLLDTHVTEVELITVDTAGRQITETDREQSIPLPRIAESLSFRYLHPETMLLADRGVRVTFDAPVSDDLARRLRETQRVWEAVCEGGCCPDGTHPVECTMFAAPGVMIAPHIYEMKIGAFTNSERCFDYFANAMERVAHTVQRVASVEVW